MTLEYEFQTIGVSGSQESKPKFIGFHHVTWYVSNARQVASYYITRFGFEKIAFQGLETGSRNISSIVVSNGEIKFVFKSALRNPSTILDETEAKAAKEICDHVVVRFKTKITAFKKKTNNMMLFSPSQFTNFLSYSDTVTASKMLHLKLKISKLYTPELKKIMAKSYLLFQ